MPPVDRLNPIRANSSESSYSLMEFMREFPNDEAPPPDCSNRREHRGDRPDTGRVFYREGIVARS
jgi:hypothetical protein